MTYAENILAEARKIISDKKLNATIEMNGLSAYLVINGERKDFATPKLAKIYVQNYQNHDTIDSVSIASGIVSQKNDEPAKKRRGRPRKADNDRTRRI